MDKDFPYQKFDQYFIELIKRNFDDLEFKLSNFQIDNLNQFYVSGRLSEQIQEFINSLTQNQKTQRQMMVLLTNQSKIMKKVLQKVSEVIKQNQNGYNPSQVVKDKLQIFICSKLISQWKFSQILTKYFEMSMTPEQLGQFYKQFKKIITISNQQKFKLNAEKMFNKQEEYQLFSPQVQKQIIQKVFQRKLNYQRVQNVLDEYGVSNINTFLEWLQKLSFQDKDQIQSQDIFKERVMQILIRYCKKIKKYSTKVLQQLFKNLYSQITLINKEKIYETLINARLFQSPSDIKFQMLKQIYKIQNEETFINIQKNSSQNNTQHTHSYQSKNLTNKNNQNNGSNNNSGNFNKTMESNTKKMNFEQGLSQQKSFNNKNQKSSILNEKKEWNQSSIRLNQREESNNSEIYLRKTQSQVRYNHIDYQNQPSQKDNQYHIRNRQEQCDLQSSFRGKQSKLISQQQRINNERQNNQYYLKTSRNKYDDFDQTGSVPDFLQFNSSKIIYDAEDTKSVRSNRTNQLSQFSEGQQKKKKQDSSQIKILNEQISLIKAQIKQQNSFQRVIREIQINVRNENINQITEKCNKLKELIDKYQLECNIQNQLQQILNSVLKKDDKLPKIISLRRKIQGLNLQQIVRTKKQIQLNKQCKNASGVILIGQTGAGKSTTLVGIGGFQLKFNQQTNDYQPIDQSVGKQYKISSSTMSVTRWANVSKLNQLWTGDQKIVSVDTPGLDDNRGVEIDITNNIGTVKLLRTLKKGRILIVLSMKNFRDRWYSDFVRIIKNISKYLIDVKTIKRSTTFVLTKGLTSKQLYSQFLQFKKSQGFPKQNWNPNQKELINLFELRLKQLPSENQILDPSNHEFQALVEKIISIGATEQIGNYIDTSFSRDAEQYINKTFNYLKFMAIKTFENLQFVLTIYYLNRIITLQQIYAHRKQYEKCKQIIKQLLKQKVDTVQNFMNEFLQYGIENNLNIMKQKYDELLTKQAIRLYQILYKKVKVNSIAIQEVQNGDNLYKQNHLQQYPNELVKSIIKSQVQEFKNKLSQILIKDFDKKPISDFNNVQKIEKKQKKIIIYNLILIRKFESQKQYKYIIERIEKQNKSITKGFLKFLQNQTINEQDWKIGTQIFNHQIQFDIDKINNDNQRFIQMGTIIQRYLKERCKQKDQIINLIDQSLTVSLDGALWKKADPFMNKLNIIKKSHTIFRQIIEPVIKSFVEKFQDKIIYFQKQQEKCVKNLDCAVLNNFQTYQKNKKQIYQILLSLNQTNVHQFRFEKQQENMFKNIQRNVKQHIKKLWTSMENLSKNPQLINFQQIIEQLHEIFNILQFIKKRKDQSLKPQNSNKIKDVQTKMLQDTLLKSQNILNQIELKIQQISIRTKVSNNELNNKLIICYFVLRECENYKHENQNDKKAENRKQIQNNIKTKLLFPFNQINNISFKQIEDYEKLCIVLRYLRLLDIKFIELGTKISGFDDIFPLYQSQSIKQIFIKSFNEMNSNYNKLQQIANVFRLKHINSEQNHIQDIQLSKKLNNTTEDNLEIQNINDNNSKQKQLIDNDYKMTLFFDKNLIKQISSYILKYDNLKKISMEFKDQLPIIDDYLRKINEIDIKEEIIKRIQILSQQIQIVKSPTKSKHLTRQDLYSVFKQIQFISKILKQCRIKVDKYDIDSLKLQLKTIIDKQHTDFDTLYKAAISNYKNLKTGVDFDDLRTLLHHNFSIDDNNKKRITKLLQDIQKQYSRILKNFFPQLGKNTDILINMAQFATILQQQKYSVSIKFYADDFKYKCKRYFGQLYKKMQNLKQSISMGISRPQKQIDQILLEQDKILTFLPDQYKQFKEKYLRQSKDKSLNLIKPQNWNLKQYINQQCKLIQIQITNKYFKQNKSDFEIDDRYRQVYNSTSKKNKLIMKNLYIERCKKKIQQMQRYLNQDHEQLEKSLTELTSQLQKIPTQIQQQIRQQFQNLKKKQQVIISQLTQKIQNFANEKSLQKIIREIDYSQKLKSVQLKRITLESLQKYYYEEKKDINFSDMNKFEKKIDSYLKITKSELFKKLSQKMKQPIQNQHCRYIEQITEQLNSSNVQLINQLVKYKQALVDKNRTQNFKICTYISLKQYTGVKYICQRIRFQNNHPNFFKSQFKTLTSKIQQIINNYKQQCRNIIQIIKQQYRPHFKNTQFNKVQKSKFIETIKHFCIFKDINMHLSQLIKIINPSDKNFNKYIEEGDKLLRELEDLLQNEYNKIQNFDLQFCLSNDTQQRLSEKFNKTQEVILSLNDFMPIISHTNNQRIQTIEIKLQTFLLKTFKEFEAKTLEDLEQCFKNPYKANDSKIRKYYDLLKLLSIKKFKIFPKNVPIKNMIRDQLLRKFFETVGAIKKFANDAKKIKQFGDCIQEQIRLTQTQNSELNKKQKQTQKEREQKKKENQIQKKKRISAAQTKEEAAKNIEIAEIQRKFRVDQNTKIAEYNNQLQLAKNVIKQLHKQKRTQIQSKISTLINQSLLSNLVIYQHAITYFSCQQKIFNHSKSLNKQLKQIQKNFKKKFTKYLYICLNENGSNDCLQIIQYPIFKPYQASVFAEQTIGQTIQKLVDQIKSIRSDDKKKDLLVSRYQTFQGYYSSILDRHRTSNNFTSSQTSFINQAKSLGKKLGIAYQNNQQSSDDIIQLLAHVFALWTIIQADQDQGKQINYIYKPHAGQVLAIFFLVGLQNLTLENCDENITFKKRIMQVSTGQGKSVVLGVLSAYLALIGYQVYQACFSKYLSQRDYHQFKMFFAKLSILNKIKYGIFPQTCKMMLDDDPTQTFTQRIQRFIQQSKQGVISKIFHSLSNLLSSNSKQPIASSINKKILLIDEADVFLDENYLGESYRPTIRYSTENVQKLLQFVWSLRDEAQSLNPQYIIKSQQFKNVIKQFRNNKIFQQIMKNQVHGMIRDLVGYKYDTYSIIKNRIFYKQGDGLSDKIRYGYRTLFSYFYRHEITKQIHKSDVLPHIALYFVAASFSYSELPGCFNSILGVTGTLQSISQSQKQILKQNFDLQNFILPSIYPPSKRQITFFKVNNSQLYGQIMKSIDEEYKKKRPILVFFKTKSQVYNFADSNQFTKYKANSSIITYEVDAKDRDFRIKTATDQCKISLLTVDFSRGTDFKVKAKNKEQHPGLHVIGAYLPQSFSDYIQLIGRTGRQGRRGSSLIYIALDDQTLINNKVSISQQEGQNIIKQFENKHWVTKKKQLKLKIQQANDQHRQSLSIYNKKQKPFQIDQLLKNLKKLNEEPQLSLYKSKTIICIDGTGSMSPVFEKVKQVISGAIPDIYDSIKKNNLRAEFQIKFAVYRNYNSDHEKLLEHSNFFNKKDQLLKWIKKIKVSGGWGNEAVEVCLQHINNLHDINQFIIIADASSNDKNETIYKRGSNINGESYWISHNYPITTYDDQLEKIIQKKIKGHSYYIGAYNKAFYDNLSNKTGGVSQQFLIYNPDATKNFADFVANQILANLGDMIGGNAKKDLLQTYSKISNKKKYV